MRDYGRISPSFWTKGSGKRLRGHLDAQVLGMYLLSCSSATMLGLYYLPIVTIAYETGLTVEAVRVAFAKTEEAGFALYDEEADLVWIPNAPQHEFGDALELKDNRRKWIEKQLKALPPHRFVTDFYARYGAQFLLNCPRDKESRLPPSKGVHGSPSEVGPTTPFEGVRNQEQKQDQKQEQERPPPVVVDDLPKIAPKRREPQNLTAHDRYGDAYAEGQKLAVPGSVFQRPAENWDVRALVAFVTTPGWGGGLEGEPLLEAIRQVSASYRRACNGDGFHIKKGFPPEMCLKWAQGAEWRRPKTPPPRALAAPRTLPEEKPYVPAPGEAAGVLAAIGRGGSR